MVETALVHKWHAKYAAGLLTLPEYIDGLVEIQDREDEQAEQSATMAEREAALAELRARLVGA